MNRDKRGYWYRSKREGKRVVREYFGNGAFAELTADLDQHDRKRAAQRKRGREKERRRFVALDNEAESFCGAVTAATRAELERHGYRQHKRGEWRKQRMKQLQDNTLVKSDPVAETIAFVAPLMKKAETDKEARRQVFEALDAQDMTRNFVTMYDIAGQAEKFLLVELYGEREFSIECEARNLRMMRKELEGSNPTPLEKLLVQRIVFCWAAVHGMETVMSRGLGEVSLVQSAYQQKRVDSAHKRYISSIKALAQVRKLQLPNVQVNIGEKQVNIG